MLKEAKDTYNKLGGSSNDTMASDFNTPKFHAINDRSSIFSNFYYIILLYIVYSGMRLVFPIAMHTIEIIKQYNTCAFYIHKSKKEEKK